MTYESLNSVLYELTMSLHGLLATQRHLLFRVSHPGFKDMVPTHADDYRNALGVISQCQARLESTMQNLIHQRITNSTPNSATGMYFSPALNRIATNINSDLENAVDQLVGGITDTESIQAQDEPIEPAGDADDFDGNA